MEDAAKVKTDRATEIQRRTLGDGAICDPPGRRILEEPVLDGRAPCHQKGFRVCLGTLGVNGNAMFGGCPIVEERLGS